MRISDWSSDVCSSDLQGSERGERRIDVDRLGKLVGRTALDDARSRKDQRDMRRLFHIGVLGPDAMIAEVIAMIAPQDDDGVVGKPFAFERLENLADLDIDVGNADRKSTRLNSSH